MSFRTTYILFGILGGLVSFFGLAVWLGPTKKIDSALLFPSTQDEKDKVTTDDVVKVEIERKDDDLSLVFEREKGDKEFKLEEPGGYRISSSLVFSVISD